MFKHLLVPVDGSPLSNKCVRRAIEFAQQTGAKLSFFHAKPSLPLPYLGIGSIADPEWIQQAQLRAEQAAEIFLGEAVTLAQQGGVSPHRLSSAGEPWEQIIRAAEQQLCDVIFMASHGRSVVNGLLLGSETQKVLSHSRIPVLVYR